MNSTKYREIVTRLAIEKNTEEKCLTLSSPDNGLSRKQEKKLLNNLDTTRGGNGTYLRNQKVRDLFLARFLYLLNLKIPFLPLFSIKSMFI